MDLTTCPLDSAVKRRSEKWILACLWFAGCTVYEALIFPPFYGLPIASKSKDHAEVSIRKCWRAIALETILSTPLYRIRWSTFGIPSSLSYPGDDYKMLHHSNNLFNARLSWLLHLSARQCTSESPLSCNVYHRNNFIGMQWLLTKLCASEVHADSVDEFS